MGTSRKNRGLQHLELVERIEVYNTWSSKKICEFSSVKDASEDMLIPEAEIYEALAYGLLVDGNIFIRRFVKSGSSRKTRQKQVAQIDIEGNELAIYDSVTQATRLTCITNIDKAARGEIKFAGGYVWKYK